MNHHSRILLWMLAASTRIIGAQHFVSSADEFHSLTLSAGDEVVWANGTYSDDDNINFSWDGTASNPITLRAETPGEVVFTGGMTMTIPGDHVVVDGFYWSGGDGRNNHIQFRNNTDYANHSTIRNCGINDLTASGTDKHRWIVLYGTNNTVENCSFVNKRSPGALILVELDYHDAATPVGHTIRNNYFYNYEYRNPESTHSGDSETIRIGSSSDQAKSASTVVENNYFQACDGENEIITNKSTDNSYLHNTFRNCHGSLVLRHGANAQVEGNFFLGENKVGSGGIRVSDSFHTIINNYFQDLNNADDKWNNAITLVGGSDETGGTSNGYQKVDGILVAFNTVYHCDDPLFYNDRSSYDPTGVFAYNLLHSTSSDAVGGDISGTGQGMSYVGNMVSVSDIGITDPGFAMVSPGFVADGEIHRPSSSSPVSGAAGSDYSSMVDFDIEGKTRPDSGMDVGAHEVSGGVGSAAHAPHTDDDVRTLVGAGFLNAAGEYVGDSGVGTLSVGSPPEFPHLAGSVAISVSCDVAWSAVEEEDWISIAPSSGTGNGSVTISVTENTSGSGRSGTITFTTESLTRSVTVSQSAYVEPVPVTGVELSPASATITEGGRVRLTATVTPEDALDQALTFSSSDLTVATVDSVGEVTGTGAGTATITVTTHDGSFSGTSAVTVTGISSVDNLALGKTVTGNEPQAANPLSHLTDGDATNRWSAETYPQSVTVDLGELCSLERSELVMYNDRAYQYTIEVATDPAGPYTGVIDRTDNRTAGTSDSPVVDVFPEVEGRYVRITVVGAHEYTGDWISLSEFRVFGESLATSTGYRKWLTEYPELSGTAPEDDSDGDHLSNLLEYILRGDPRHFDQNHWITWQTTTEGCQLKLNRSSDSVNDSIQLLQYSSDMESWRSIDFTTDANSGVNVETNEAVDTVTILIPGGEIPDDQLFWRVRAELKL